MRGPARVALASVWLLAIGGASAWPQSAPPPGARQVPARSAHDQAAKPPAAVPHQPVRKTEGARTGKTPVVPPHGPIHPHKPVAAALPERAAPAQAAVAPVVPVQPPADAKAGQSAKPSDSEQPEGAAGKLPRFASLRSDDVNMRAGPGTRYRIDWVYKRRDLPVEIERQFDIWRWVRDADGIQGWVHQATLMGRRSFIVQKTDATLRSEAADSASAVAILKPGVIGRIRSCEASSDWCNVQTGPYRGYLRRQQFWGVFPGEAVNP